MRTIIRALTITIAILLPLVVMASQHLIAEALELKGQRLRLEGDFHTAKQIEAKLSKLPVLARAIADELTFGRLKDYQVEARLKGALYSHPEVSAVAACYKPEFVPRFAEQPHKPPRYCPYSYWTKTFRGIAIRRVEEDYDYTELIECYQGLDPDIPCFDSGPRTSWYHRPLAEGPVWGEPYGAQGLLKKVY